MRNILNIAIASTLAHAASEGGNLSGHGNVLEGGDLSSKVWPQGNANPPVGVDEDTSEGATGTAVQVVDGTGGMIEAHGEGIKEGTMIPKNMVAKATDMLNAFYAIQDQTKAASRLVLELAAEAVRSTAGEYKLALVRFQASIASAVSDMRGVYKDSDAETKAKVEEFLDPSASWAQYVSNVSGALRERFELVDVTAGDNPEQWPLLFQSEYSLRMARQAAKRLKNHTRTAIQRAERKVDVTELSADDMSSVNAAIEHRAKQIKAKTGQEASETQIMQITLEELEKAGAPKKIETEEPKGDSGDGSAVQRIKAALESDDNADEGESWTECAGRWADDLGLDDTVPAFAKVRNAFIGLVTVMAHSDFDIDGDDIALCLDNAKRKLVQLNRAHLQEEPTDGEYEGADSDDAIQSLSNLATGTDE
jgi:hypothetical protein